MAHGTGRLLTSCLDLLGPSDFSQRVVAAALCCSQQSSPLLTLSRQLSSALLFYFFILLFLFFIYLWDAAKKVTQLKVLGCQLGRDPGHVDALR